MGASSKSIIISKQKFNLLLDDGPFPYTFVLNYFEDTITVPITCMPFIVLPVYTDGLLCSKCV